MESRENMELTCVMCENTCKRSEMPTHKCLKGYRKFFIDAKTLHFYPMLDDGKTILRRSSAVNNDFGVTVKQENWSPNTPDLIEDGVGRKMKSNFSVRKSSVKKLTDAETDTLISEIQKRKPLWDFSLSIEKRNKEMKQKLWDEVAEKFQGKLSAKEVQNKFKCLRDTHRKIIQSELQAAGSVRESQPKWKHYDALEFLRSSCMIKNTETNVTNKEYLDNDLTTDLPSERGADDAEDSFESANVRWKRLRRDSQKEVDDFKRVLNKISDSVCNDESSNIVLPPPPQPDEVDSILHAVGLQLRRIPYSKRMETLIDIMRITYAKVAEENIKEL